MPDFPDRREWKWETIGDTWRRMSRNKAPGLDEWRVYDMRAWPKHLLVATASLLEDV